MRLFLLELHMDVYELCFATKPLRIGRFHDQFRYSPEPESLGQFCCGQKFCLRSRGKSYHRLIVLAVERLIVLVGYTSKWQALPPARAAAAAAAARPDPRVS